MTTFVRQPKKQREPFQFQMPSGIPQFVAASISGAILFSFLVLIIWGSYQVWYWNRIFPGVSVAGVDLSGLPPEEASVKLNQFLVYPYSGRIVFEDNGRVWVTTPAQLGLVFDPNGSATYAYDLGRDGGIFRGLGDQITAAQSGKDVGPVVIFDQRVAYQYLQSLALEINQPVLEARLAINGTEVFAEPGQIGRMLNVEATLTYLNAQLQSFRDGEVPLVISEVAPEVLEVNAQAEQARMILSAPVALVLPNAEAGDPGPWNIDIASLAQMLTIERVETNSVVEFKLAFDPDKLRAFITELAKGIDRTPKNARFIFNDNTRQLDLLQDSLIGRTVKVDESLQLIRDNVLAGARQIPLAVDFKEPLVKGNSTAEELSIRELVSSQTSYFRGSSSARLQNIQTAAAQFHGVLVAPGAVFSMGEIMGDVSLDNGYAEALIIYGGKTIKGVGGGVCQVSTTLFRTAFFGGYPIAERHPHAYRVYYYEQNAGGIDRNLSGMDATVFFPLVDFKFTNDSPYWLLMETYFDPSAYTLTWKFYSTSDGRSITWETTGPTNITEPPKPEFRLNLDLNPRAFQQVDYAADGADITVTRTVWRSGQALYTDTFETLYQAWRAVYEYGSEIEDPEKELKKRNGSD